MTKTIAQEAAREWFLFTIGVKRAQDIIAWADEKIIDEENPDARILELSTTSPERTEIFVSELQRLKEGSDVWQAVGDGLGAVHDYLASRPADAERIANALYMIASWHPQGMPDQFSFIFHFDDAFYLAREGIYGGTSAVLADFLSHLAVYKKAAQPGATDNPDDAQRI